MPPKSPANEGKYCERNETDREPPGHFGRLGIGSTESKTDQNKGRPPKEAPEDVEEEELPVTHLTHPGKAGDKGSGQSDPPSEEYSRTAVTDEEILALLHPGVSPKGSVIKEPGTEELPDLVPDGVPDDGPAYDYEHHEEKVGVVKSRYGSSHQSGGLSRDYETEENGCLGEYEKADYQIYRRTTKVDQRAGNTSQSHRFHTTR